MRTVHAPSGRWVALQRLIEAAMADPWRALGTVLDGPLHPGGEEATEQLLDRVGVEGGARVLDVGCGAGESVARARERGARAIGLDRAPGSEGIRGEMTRLPIRAGSVDVVLAECTLCLAVDRSLTRSEFRRVLAPDGRLALSDVVVEGDLPELPGPVVEALCLARGRSRTELVEGLDAAGFAVEDVRDHREDLLDMRDRLADRVDYEGLLGRLGDDELLGAVSELERAVEAGRVGYVSLVAEPRPD